ncbi:MAG: hypothetical protein HYU75_10155 [Betaproteobacteria bacterium]|nr:hypothetical protein [Betaproteobacteria bacterium]
MRAKVLRTLATTTVEFDESDVYLFSKATLQLIATLFHARLSGWYAEADWPIYA